MPKYHRPIYIYHTFTDEKSLYDMPTICHKKKKAFISRLILPMVGTVGVQIFFLYRIISVFKAQLFRGCGIKYERIMPNFMPQKNGGILPHLKVLIVPRGTFRL